MKCFLVFSFHSRRSASEADPGGQVEHHGEVGAALGRGDLFQRADQARVHLAKGALIDAGGISEAVADHECAARQGRQNRLHHMVDARRGKEHGLGGGPQRRRRARQDHLAQSLRHRRAAGLAGHDAFMAEAAQMLGQKPGLGGLPSPLPAFQRYEFAARRG